MKKLLPVLLLGSIALTACAAPYPYDYYDDDYRTDRYEHVMTVTMTAMMIVTTTAMSAITTVMTTTVTATANITMTTTSNTKFTAIRLSNKNAHK